MDETGAYYIGDYFPLALCIFGLPSFLNTRVLLLGQGKQEKTPLKKNKLKGKRIPELCGAAMLSRHLT